MNLALYELPLDDQLYLGEGKNFNTHCVAEDNIPLFRRDDELLVTQENQHRAEVRPSSPNHEHKVEHENRRIDSPPIKDFSSLRDRERHTFGSY